MAEEVVRRGESPINGYLATFKFYDSKNRRLSIFGRLVDDQLEITVLTISKTPEMRVKYFKGTKDIQKQEIVFDTFSKKAGRKKYERECIHGNKCPGKVFKVDIFEDRPRYTFLKWCNEHFYREVKEEVVVTKTRYVKGTKFVHPEKEKKAVLIPLGEHEDKSQETA